MFGMRRVWVKRYIYLYIPVDANHSDPRVLSRLRPKTFIRLELKLRVSSDYEVSSIQ